ncbi:TetR/AcrR family transcriptional regulator [Arthrobacter sp. zg-Y877]|uniref:TetR/AcrR family transcriptional regulator n=1 Tax=Arthrobacter sp. zg-Y877 TaxID=3049074 RepID=UPI0025A46029|nr:TetR/AcrR family transcriptional regulator [Arthrobacter sp. zg-Y877]MDM7991467.1 TetR/AcrR family transcriptional regulator [Arthrobacter sp. zg-Y877]
MTDTRVQPGWRDFSVPALPPLLRAALDCFVEHGYHGTTIRTVATRAGLSVPGLYHHYPSKQALLVGIAESAMADLYARSTAALAEAGGDVEQRFALLIECLVLVHAYRWEHAFIAASEIRSLEGPARAGHIAARDRQQKLLDDVVAEAVRSGRFTTGYPKDASRAVTTMCTGVAQWYRAGGPLPPEELAERYVQICRGAVGAV